MEVVTPRGAPLEDTCTSLVHGGMPRFGAEISAYVVKDLEVWFDIFVESSAVMQYAIFYNYELFPHQGGLLKKSKKLDFAHTLQQLIAKKTAALNDRLESDLRDLRRENAGAHTAGGGGGGGALLSDAKAILEEERLREEMHKEARNTPFCHSQEKFHTVVLSGVRNISEAP
jgi:hypothetical protein